MVEIAVFQFPIQSDNFPMTQFSVLIFHKEFLARLGYFKLLLHVIFDLRDRRFGASFHCDGLLFILPLDHHLHF